MIAKGRDVRTPPPIFHGDKHPMSKLTWDQVAEIRSLYESEQLSAKQLADRYDITPSNVGCVIHYQTWRDENSPDPIYPGSTKLTEDDVQSIRSEYATGNVLQRELAQRYNVSQSLISQILSHKRRTNVLV
jgi:DNA-binding MarR family transcriptional regulator